MNNNSLLARRLKATASVQARSFLDHLVKGSCSTVFQKRVGSSCGLGGSGITALIHSGMVGISEWQGHHCYVYLREPCKHVHQWFECRRGEVLGDHLLDDPKVGTSTTDQLAMGHLALAHDDRLLIVAALLLKERLSIGQISAVTDLPQYRVSRAVQALMDGDVVRKEILGPKRLCSVNAVLLWDIWKFFADLDWSTGSLKTPQLARQGASGKLQ